MESYLYWYTQVSTSWSGCKCRQPTRWVPEQRLAWGSEPFDLFEGWNSVKMMNQQFSHSNYSLLWSGKCGKFQVLMSVLKQLNEWNPEMIPINIWQFFQPCHDLGVGRLTKIGVFLRVYVSWGMVKSCHEWQPIPTVIVCVDDFMSQISFLNLWMNSG